MFDDTGEAKTLKHKRLLLMVMAIALLCSACLGGVNYGADSAGTNYFPNDALTVNAQSGHTAVADLQQRWKIGSHDASLPCDFSTDTGGYNNFATPAVWESNHIVFMGFVNGCFLAVDDRNASVLWHKDFAPIPDLSCKRGFGYGMQASPILSEEDTANGKQEFVYVHAPNGTVYKFDVLTGADVWVKPPSIDPLFDPTKNDHLPWQLSTVIPKIGPQGHGLIVATLSSECDVPFSRGGMVAIDIVTGEVVWRYYTEPADPANSKWDVGAGIWARPAVAGTYLIGATGSVAACKPGTTDVAANPENNPGPLYNKPNVPESGYKLDPSTNLPVFTGVIHQCEPPVNEGGNQYSMVKVDAATGTEVKVWHAPPLNGGDPDFGSGVTVFPATSPDGLQQVQLAASCNKNGVVYALDTDTMLKKWEYKIGDSTSDGGKACLSAPVYDKDHKRLFLTGNHIIDPNGIPDSGDEIVLGEIQEINPWDGTPIGGQRELSAEPLNSCALNPNGILACAMMHWGVKSENGIYLIDTNDNLKVVRVLKDASIGQAGCNNPTGDPNLRCTPAQYPQPIFADGGLVMANESGVAFFR